MKLRDNLDISDKFKIQEIKFTITVLRRFLASAFHARVVIAENKEDKVTDFTTKKLIGLLKAGNFSVLEQIDFKLLF